MIVGIQSIGQGQLRFVPPDRDPLELLHIIVELLDRLLVTLIAVGRFRSGRQPLASEALDEFVVLGQETGQFVRSCNAQK